MPATGSKRLAIVVSRFNETVTGELLAGAREFVDSQDALEADVFWVPGAWELPVAAQAAARSARYDAVVALGCVIRGETPHFDFVAGQAAEGLMRVSLDSNIPIAFGVLTTENLEQAMVRAGGKGGNKGYDATQAAIEMTEVLERIGAST